jgi:hypothetical protein
LPAVSVAIKVVEWAAALEEHQVADSVHQQAGLQHLAHLRQEDSVPRAVVLGQQHLQHQVALAEAALEAHLQQQVSVQHQ